METKLFELRDRGTFIPLLCVKPGKPRPHRSDCAMHNEPAEPNGPCNCGVAFEYKMAWRYGYRSRDDFGRAIIVTHMSEPRRGCYTNPLDWNDRTFQVAHRHIEKHWDELKSGDLIDVRFILGETDKPCESEAYTAALARLPIQSIEDRHQQFEQARARVLALMSKAEPQPSAERETELRSAIAELCCARAFGEGEREAQARVDAAIVALMRSQPAADPSERVYIVHPNHDYGVHSVHATRADAEAEMARKEEKEWAAYSAVVGDPDTSLKRSDFIGQHYIAEMMVRGRSQPAAPQAPAAGEGKPSEKDQRP